MEISKGCYVLMLVYVDGEWRDIGDNLYPLEGYIEAQEFTRDIDIRYGLNGIPWGKTCFLPYEKIDGNWIVVKTEFGEDLITTDFYYNRYKFKNGNVVYSGNLRSAAEYIIDNKDDDDLIDEATWIQSEDIAGSKEWLEEYCNEGII